MLRTSTLQRYKNLEKTLGKLLKMEIVFLPEVFFPIPPTPFHKGEQFELCLLFRMVSNKLVSHILRIIQLSMENKMINLYFLHLAVIHNTAI